MATKPITKGQELLLDYGVQYWRQAVKRQRRAAALLERDEHGILVHAATVNEAPLYLSEFTPDPQTAQEALARHDAAQWQTAIDKEQKSLRDLKVYSVVTELPRGARVLGSRMVFKIKRDAAGRITKYKVRLVAQGFSQREGLDYDVVYSPTVRYGHLRCLLALAADANWEIDAVDVETAYLFAELEPGREIYISTPHGFTGPEAGRFLRLHRALYGLKQSAHLWNGTLDAALRHLDFVATTFYDECVYVRRSNTGGSIFVTVYVDDLLFFYSQRDSHEVGQLKTMLGQRFTIKELGSAREILGIRITRDRAAHTMWLDQAAYAQRIVDSFGYTSARGEFVPERVSSAPLRRPSTPPSFDSEHKQITLANFRSFVGQVAYLANSTRPDICHAVNMLQRAFAAPDDASLASARHLLRYLSSHADLRLRYGVPTIQADREVPADALYAYSDSDWAGDEKDARSTSGFVIMFKGGPHRLELPQADHRVTQLRRS